MPPKAYIALLNHAQRQYGYVTPQDARELGITPDYLRVLVARDGLEKFGRGLYRVPLVPHTELDPYMEAVLWTRRQGVLSHETALDLHDLCDVNPAAIHLSVPKEFRTRIATPPTYRLHPADLDKGDVAMHEGIPVVTPERAILDGIEQHLGAHLIYQAIETARARGLITKPTARRLATRAKKRTAAA